MSILFVFVVVVAAVIEVIADPASDQISNYKKRSSCPHEILTTSNGAPVEFEDTKALNSPLIPNQLFMETMSHLVRERLPDRVVHAKGAGAFGYFEVTHNTTDICKANLFNKDGKKTRVVVRFSPTSLDKGEADSNVDSRGFAIKFYTDDGNFDLVCFHTPMFTYKEPFLVQPVSRVIKRNPVTNLKDPNMLWDLITLRPETAFFFLHVFGDSAFPNGYRYLPGFPIHTYQIYNNCGKSCFVRFHITPDLGIRNITLKEAINLAATDPDYAVRDLYNAIAEGDFPTWTISMQVLNFEDVKKAKFDVFDVTKILPLDKYPLRPLGKLVLNENPVNYFADVEQAAFCPANLVPGILGGPDKLFEARRFAYKDSQRYRLGVNFNKIRVNCPYNNVFTYDRDGKAPVGDNGGSAPNYYPNSYHGPVPYFDKNRPSLIKIRQYDDSYNFEQITDMYNGLSNDERSRLTENIVLSLQYANKCLQDRVIQLFNSIHPELAFRTTVALTRTSK